MRRFSIRFVVAATATAVSFATCAFFLSSTPASAGLLDPVTSIVPTPILSPVTGVTDTVTNLLSSPTPLPSVPIVNDLLSPLPTVTGVPAIPLPGSLNDTINQITGTLTNPVSTPSQPAGGGGTTGTGTTGHQTGTTGTTGTVATTGSARSDATATGLTSVDGTGVLTQSLPMTSPYGEIAGDALRHAAGRALHLVGPFAPPMLLGLVALAILMLLTRGSTALVKIDTAPLTGRRWRI